MYVYTANTDLIQKKETLHTYNIPAGKTPADMPDDWVCPECAALGVDAFIVEEE